MEGAQEGVLDLSRRKNRQRKNNRSIFIYFYSLLLKMAIGKKKLFQIIFL